MLSNLRSEIQSIRIQITVSSVPHFRTLPVTGANLAFDSVSFLLRPTQRKPLSQTVAVKLPGFSL